MSVGRPFESASRYQPERVHNFSIKFRGEVITMRGNKCLESMKMPTVAEVAEAMRLIKEAASMVADCIEAMLAKIMDAFRETKRAAGKRKERYLILRAPRPSASLSLTLPWYTSGFL